jgi:hypothetical protein
MIIPYSITERIISSSPTVVSRRISPTVWPVTSHKNLLWEDSNIYIKTEVVCQGKRPHPNSDIEKWERSDREDLETFFEQTPQLFRDDLLSQ